MFSLAFVNTSQDWLILQNSLASLRVAHMASHWGMTVDAAKFNISVAAVWNVLKAELLLGMHANPLLGMLANTPCC
jgi:hypothetical protein